MKNNAKAKTKKSYRIKNKFRFITFLTVLMLITAFGSSAIFGLGDAAGSDKTQYVSVKVEAGDTLWNLAKEYGPSNVDLRRVIYEIEKINNIDAGSLQTGMIITIPSANI